MRSVFSIVFLSLLLVVCQSKLLRTNHVSENQTWNVVYWDFSLQEVDDQGIQNISTGLKNYPNTTNLTILLNSQGFQQQSIGILMQSIAVMGKNLVYLNLGFGQDRISEVGCEQFKYAFQNITQLDTLVLNLYHNKINPNGAVSLARSLELLSNLKSLTLNIGGNLMDNDGVSSLAVSLGKLTQVNYADLQIDDNNLGNLGADYLGQALSNLTKLTYLSLRIFDNVIQSKGASDLARGLSGLKSLVTLDLQVQYNLILDSGAFALAQKTSALPLLQTINLNLDGNNVGTVKQNITSSKNTHVNSLTLSVNDNSIQSESASTAIAIFLKDFSNLTTLNFQIGNNGVGDSQFQNIVQGLKNQKANLQNLQIEAIAGLIGDAGFSDLSSFVVSQLNLESLVLDFDQNNITSQGFFVLTFALNKFTKLTKLQLNFNLNNLGTASITQLSQALASLKNLTYLKILIDYNSVSYDSIKALSDTILSSLTKLGYVQYSFYGNDVTPEQCQAIQLQYYSKTPLCINTENCKIYC